MRNLILLCVVLWGNLGFGQEPFEGIITYDLRYVEFPEGKKGLIHSFPKKETWYVQGQNLRIDQFTDLAGKTSYYQHGDSTYRVFQFLGKQTLIPTTGAEQVSNREIIRGSAIEPIAGMQTVKVEIADANGQSHHVWVVPSYINPSKTLYPEVPFLMLKAEYEREGVRVEMIARSIEYLPLDDSYFTIPSPVVRISEAQLQRILK